MNQGGNRGLGVALGRAFLQQREGRCRERSRIGQSRVGRSRVDVVSGRGSSAKRPTVNQPSWGRTRAIETSPSRKTFWPEWNQTKERELGTHLHPKGNVRHEFGNQQIQTSGRSSMNKWLQRDFTGLQKCRSGEAVKTTASLEVPRQGIRESLEQPKQPSDGEERRTTEKKNNGSLIITSSTLTVTRSGLDLHVNQAATAAVTESS